MTAKAKDVVCNLVMKVDMIAEAKDKVCSLVNDTFHCSRQCSCQTAQMVMCIVATSSCICRGMNLVQLAVSVACRSTVSAYCEAQPQSNSGPSFWQQLLDFGTTPNGEKLYSACIGTFVREGTKASICCSQFLSSNMPKAHSHMHI